MPPIRVADEVWIAAALLHRRYPDREDFTVGEIVRARPARSAVAGRADVRPGVQSHAYLHCVANRAPNPGRYRMLVETVEAGGGGCSGRAIRAIRCALGARTCPSRATCRRPIAG